MNNPVTALRQKGVCLSALEISIRTIDLHATAPAYARLLAVLRGIGFPLEGAEETQES